MPRTQFLGKSNPVRLPVRDPVRLPVRRFSVGLRGSEQGEQVFPYRLPSSAYIRQFLRLPVGCLRALESEYFPNL